MGLVATNYMAVVPPTALLAFLAFYNNVANCNISL